MKKLAYILFVFIISASFAYAGSVWVKGYKKKNETYPHYCSTPIKSRTDNHSYPGVYQPPKRKNIYNVYD